ncbi:hypothetical protein FOZ63_022553 [Perkinsus olseni]|uniref:Serine aminopeptidase S33 domain-containing protein n=1 Tax=Perkinsus olseni TaxID=32597 RepID=A0A7J6R2N2_PEROL|nr:hypothetical protein FOZ62_022885 [Perkinsus olseni]KAF4727897.1 hypothetical protein FOZ63_022553 [Perkinsus olseni]
MILPQYNALWKAIIRPSRDTYEDHELGPSRFRIRGVPVYREDIELTNPRGQHLKCSWFHPNWKFDNSDDDDDQEACCPCVIYLHGNCSSRLEGLQAVPVLLPLGISLFVFDFAGSGESDGEYVSLGYYEKDDLAAVVEYLRGSKLVSTIGLWGRSMGAVTALLHGDRDPSIAGMIDSAFQDMRTLSTDLAQQLGFRIPGLMLSAVLGMLRLSVKSRAHFDIFDLEPIAHVDQTYIPALFTAARGDTFINPHNTDALFGKYAGDKNLVKVDGNHNTTRPKFLMHSIAIFFVNTLGCETTVDAVLDLNDLSPPAEQEDATEGQNDSRTSTDPSDSAEANNSPPRAGDLSNGLSMPSPPRERIQFDSDRLIEAAVPFSCFEEDRMVEEAIEQSMKESLVDDKEKRNEDMPPIGKEKSAL